ncbi:MAG: radical SAM protein, partial [Pseudomonadota bacterium]
MKSSSVFEKLPSMLFADEEGRIYDHPYYRMVGFSGAAPAPLGEDDLISMPEYSKLFFIPRCPPLGLDPATGKFLVVPEARIGGVKIKCQAVAAFLEPGLVRTHLPAADYGAKNYMLPMWAYAAVGLKGDAYRTAGFRIEYNPRWDPRHYDDRKLVAAIKRYEKENPGGALQNHLKGCATDNHCFAAKNLFFKRWEAPLPVSRSCNAACLGCLSLQPDQACEVSHKRIAFRPSMAEIVHLAVGHLEQGPETIVSFGQGCEGEPLTEVQLIADSIREIRRRTGQGTINLNTNGSLPERIRVIAESGLDSIRISMNSARPDLYSAYYRPSGYDFEDVVFSVKMSRDLGLYTMINYLVFPGVTDQDEEIEALKTVIRETGVNFIHLKNLNIDPQLYLEKMPGGGGGGIGLKAMVALLRESFPDLQLGYFNQP